MFSKSVLEYSLGYEWIKLVGLPFICVKKDFRALLVSCEPIFRVAFIRQCLSWKGSQMEFEWTDVIMKLRKIECSPTYSLISTQVLTFQIREEFIKKLRYLSPCPSECLGIATIIHSKMHCV